MKSVKATARPAQNRLPLGSPKEVPDPPPPVAAPYEFILGDAFDWLKNARPGSINAVVTDPPNGLLE